MAFKFLSRPEAKQRILRIDLARAVTGKKDERAIVVTAESSRLTYFWNHAAGEWRFHTRDHAPLRALAVAPHQTLQFPWSRRNGVAADGDLAAVVFKREPRVKEPVGLFLDLLTWSDADGEWRFLTEDRPPRVPLGELLCNGVGLDVWAWLTGRALHVVTQAWTVSREGLGNFSLPEPHLALLQAVIDPDRPADLEDPGSWRLTELDRGGFDLDARFEGDRIWAVHRRQAAAMSVPFNPTSDGAAAWMLDEAGTNPFNIDESLFVADMPATVVVSCDPRSGASAIEADDLPSVEHPQLQRVDPLIVTGDRLRFAAIDAARREKLWDLRPRIQTADKVMIWRGREWRMKRIGPVEHAQWPLNLRDLAPSQWMTGVRDGRLSLATMLPLKPTHLWRFDVTSKGVELTFGREDRRIGGVACHLYRASPDLVTGDPEWEGMCLLDIGHEQIALDQAGAADFPAENTQFEGRIVMTVTREDGGSLDVVFPTANTLGGLLVAHQDAGHGLSAYVGMGDGGGRVIFDPAVDPVAPTTDEAFKSLPPEVVSGPGGAGRAWVTINAASFVPGGLPGYAVPYSDIMRRVPAPQDPLTYTFVFLPAEVLLAHFTPRSLGGGLQPLLDVLPVADALLNPSSGATLDSLAATSFDLSQDQADSIQNTLGASVPEADPVAGDDTQPFAATLSVSPGLVQARSPIRFRAQVTDPTVGSPTFTWEFTPPGDGAPGVVVPFSLGGADVTVPFIIEGRWTVRLIIDAADGRRTEIDHGLDVAPTLWRQIWSAYRSANQPEIRLGTTSLEIMRHHVEFRIGPEGERQLVHIEYLPEHSAEFQFVEGTGPQQGRTLLRLPITLSSVDGRFTGMLGDAIVLKRLDLRLRLERPFTLGVVNSDRRSSDVLVRDTYAALDSTDEVEVTPEEADVETARHINFTPGRAADMTPSALAAKPVGPSALTVRDVKAEIDFTPAASVVTFLIGVVVGLQLTGLILSPLLAALLVALGPAAIIGVVVLLPLGALVAVAVSVGLGWLFLQLARAALRAAGSAIVTSRLTDPATIASIGDGLEEAGVMTYAGEGLAETIAMRAVRQAIADGHAVAPTVYDQPNADGGPGRERFRPHLFETVVVGPGVCRVLMRV